MGHPSHDLVRLFSISPKSKFPWLHVVGDQTCCRQNLVFGYVDRILSMPARLNGSMLQIKAAKGSVKQ